MDENFEDTLKNEFLMEALELANECEDAFIELERDPDNKEIIDQIFRIAHTFKGGALTVGFEELGNFSHTFENVLMRIRENQLDPTSEIVDILLEANDTINKFIHALKGNFQASIDTERVSNKLKSCLDSSGESSPPNTSDSMLTDGFGFFGDETDDSGFGFFDEAPSKKNSSPRTLKQIYASMNVLVCDDDEEILDLLSNIVEELGVNVFTSKDGKDALKVFNGNEIHSIITDLKMPGMNGIEFIKEVRKTNKDVPAIFCSGFADRDALVEFIELNAFGFIDKPFENHKVVSTIKNSLILNMLKKGIAELTKLNFNTYILISKILRSIETNDMSSIDTLKVQLESKMSEIGTCADQIQKIKSA